MYTFAMRVKCLYIPASTAPCLGLEVDPYQGCHEIFRSLVNDHQGGSVAKTNHKGTLMWISDIATEPANPRATKLAPESICGNAVVFGVLPDGNLCDIDYDLIGYYP